MNMEVQIAILVIVLLNLGGGIVSFIFLYSQLKQMHDTQIIVVQNNTAAMNSIIAEMRKVENQVEHMRSTQELGNRIGYIEQALQIESHQ